MNGLDFGTAIGLIKGLGSPDPAVIESAVSEWLDDHPEATTTVQDGSITRAKLDSNLQGTVDDVADLKSELSDIIIESVNRYDKDVISETGFYYYSGGAIQKYDGDGYVISDAIPVNPGDIVRVTHDANLGVNVGLYLDSEQNILNLIYRVTPPTNKVTYQEFVVPNGCPFIKLQLTRTKMGVYMATINADYPSEYVEYTAPSYSGDYRLADAHIQQVKQAINYDALVNNDAKNQRLSYGEYVSSRTYAKIYSGVSALISSEADDDHTFILSVQESKNKSFGFGYLRYTTDDVNADNIDSLFSAGTHFSTMTDDVCPMQLKLGNPGYNYTNIGGNHGYIGANKITAQCDISETDIGSVWSDTNQNQFVLFRVETDGNNKVLYFAHFNANTHVLEFIDEVIGLTHVSGATHQNAISPITNVQDQFRPAEGGIVNKWMVDGVEVTEYSGGYTKLEADEIYFINDPYEVCESLKTTVGSNTNNTLCALFPNPIARFSTHRVFCRNGAVVENASVTLLKDVTDFTWGVVQAGTLEYISTEPAYVYTPYMINHAIQESGPIPLTKSNMDGTIIPYRIYEFDRNKTRGMGLCYCPDINLGKNDRRGDVTTDNLGSVGPNKKLYPYLVTGQSSENVVSFSGVGARTPYFVTQGLTNLSWYFIGDDIYLSVDAHENVNKKISLPAYMNGMIINVIDKSNSCEAVDGAVVDSGFWLKITGGYGYASLKLTKFTF